MIITVLTLYVIWYNYMYTWRHTLYIQSMLCAHMSAKSIERGIMQLPVCINHCLCSSLISVLSKIGSPMHHSHMYATMIDKLIRILITAKELYICYIYIYISYISILATPPQASSGFAAIGHQGFALWWCLQIMKNYMKLNAEKST